MADMCRKGLHELTEDNVYWRANGNRQCKACHRAYYAERRRDPEWVERQRAKARERGRNPEVKRKRAEYAKQRALDPEFRERRRQYEREYRSRPEVREHRLELARGYDAKRRKKASRRDYMKAYLTEYGQRPDVLPRLRERSRVWMQVKYATDAEYREQQKARARQRRADNARTITIPASLEDALDRLGGGQ